MANLLLFCALLGSPVDEFCREHYGHPGDLGVTQAAAKHFKAHMSYKEAVATIGALGEEVPTKKKMRKIYRWEGGRLQMQFLSDYLIDYRLDGKSKVFTIAVDDAWEQQPKIHPRQKREVEPSANDPALKAEYAGFQQKAEGIIQSAHQVTENDLEEKDVHALKFLLPKLNDAVAAGDWKNAKEIRDQMKVSMKRGEVVATDAQRRITERQRAEEEQRHQEELAQQRRQHQEAMNKQQQILNELRWRRLQGR